jgi:hypothetical protein
MESVVSKHQNENKIGKKIFIPAIGSLGDVKPYLILAKELKKQGHTVWLGVHQRFEQEVKNNGKILHRLVKFIFTIGFVFILQVLIQLKLVVIWKSLYQQHLMALNYNEIQVFLK